MKKIVTLLLVVVFSLSLYAYTEPLVMLSLLSPAMLFSGESYAEEYDVSLLNQDSAILLTLPSEMQMASISLADITSDDFMTMGKAMIDLAFLHRNMRTVKFLMPWDVSGSFHHLIWQKALFRWI